MAQPEQRTNYTQGHSSHTLATQLLRTAEVEAAFLLPHLKDTDYILDVGCGPGTITTGLSKYVTKGRVMGVDISTEVLDTARTLAAEANVPTKGLGSVSFQQGNVLETLPYADESFDVVFSSQVFGHIPMPQQPLQARSAVCSSPVASSLPVMA